MRYAFIIIVAVFSVITTEAQIVGTHTAPQYVKDSRNAHRADGHRFGVAYYNIDALYDTLPSKFYDDRDYTPSGRMRWNTQRYRRKIGNIARVIDSMHMDIVALYGVENEQVVRDLVEACRSDYAYIHRTADNDNGLDFALLYFGDSFFPERVTPWRGALCVEGEVQGKPLTVIADHRSSSLGVLLDQRGLLQGNNNIIILGATNKLNFHKHGLDDLTARAEKAGRGNRIRNGRWEMYDRIAVNISGVSHCDVFARSWMLAPDGLPLPTFDRTKYYGGFGRNLPVFIYFDTEFGY